MHKLIPSFELDLAVECDVSPGRRASCAVNFFCNADDGCNPVSDLDKVIGTSRYPDAGYHGPTGARGDSRFLCLQAALSAHAPQRVLAVAVHVPLRGAPVLLTGATDGLVRVWRLDFFECVGELRGHTRAIHALVGFRAGHRPAEGEVAPCGGMPLAGVDVVLTASADNSVRLWDLHSHVCLLVLATLGMVNALAIVHVALPPCDGLVRGRLGSRDPPAAGPRAARLVPRWQLCAGCQDATVKCLLLDDVLAAAAAARPAALATARAEALEAGADDETAARARRTAMVAQALGKKPEDAVPKLAPSLSFDDVNALKTSAGQRTPVGALLRASSRALSTDSTDSTETNASSVSVDEAREWQPNVSTIAEASGTHARRVNLPVGLAPLEVRLHSRYPGLKFRGLAPLETPSRARELGLGLRPSPPCAYKMDSLVACTLRGHSGYVFALCACGDRWLCSAGGDGALVLWGRKPAAPCSGAAGACAYTLEHALPAHDGSVLSIAYHERLSLLLSGGADALIRVWDCESPSSSRAPPAVRSLSGHGGAVSALAVTDLLIISGDMVGVCCVWDA
eukprot:CAMPEP_0179843392 /NCGR_PEP_ID=MMETSP0982-20121206/3673_1 /TAXON_ID=483367 /ORGANISM="non described non described, Strain CCMP 2436" /LENGTH=567 /DNA_ID=CAMNT_0021727803 /DNA_START=201 /DNA_END=1900 /DNA_ORIENTATION=-